MLLKTHHSTLYLTEQFGFNSAAISVFLFFLRRNCQEKELMQLARVLHKGLHCHVWYGLLTVQYSVTTCNTV